MSEGWEGCASIVCLEICREWTNKCVSVKGQVHIEIYKIEFLLSVTVKSPSTLLDLRTYEGPGQFGGTCSMLLWGEWHPHVKNEPIDPTGVAQWIEHQPTNWKITGSIPSQGTCLSCGPGPQLGTCERQPQSMYLLHVSLTLFLIPFPSLYKEISRIFFKNEQTKWRFNSEANALCLYRYFRMYYYICCQINGKQSIFTEKLFQTLPLLFPSCRGLETSDAGL